jgi:poly(A) polymerase
LVAHLLRAAGDDRLALVGGAVRDWLLHRVHNDPWRGVPDLDLVVEPAGGGGAVPAAHRLARSLRTNLGEERLPFYQEHPAYGTVELEVRLAAGALLLDVASARREAYPVAGENPVVSFGRLEDDLARRDFTINAMALLLSTGRGGLARGPDGLHDPHGGRADLEKRELRFLHADSVRDDPTRVVRAARYAARLAFRLAPEARAQLERTLEAWPWAWRPGDPPEAAPSALGTRLRMELELLLEREAWPRALAALQGWGGLTLLDAALQGDHQWRRRLRWAARLELPLLAALLAGAAEPLALAERLQVPHRQHRLLAQFLGLRERLAAAEGGGPRSPVQWCGLLEGPGVAPEAVALALACGIGPRRPLLRWWLRWRHLRGERSAAALMAAEGLKPGPALGERLRQERNERLAREKA